MPDQDQVELRRRLLRRTGQFFIGGKWVEPHASSGRFALVDPATEEQYGELALGSADDVDDAVAVARQAFPAYSQTTLAQRRELLNAVLDAYSRRGADIAEAISLEMGAPIGFARDAQTPRGSAHIAAAIRALDTISFDDHRGSTMVTHEPIGVCGLITPWNWPMNQLAVKVAPALAAGCTMVLKPSEFSPLSALLFAEILAEAGVPDGVFNLINGTGSEVGHAIVTHPDVDMISFTGSTRAGIQIARAAADTVKRVGQELGGKSPNILLPDVDLQEAVSRGVAACYTNSGQSCSIPTRMLVRRDQAAAAAAIARAAADSFTALGPLVNKSQFDRVQALIAQAIAEGATLVTGGLGRPDGITRGYYVKPTVFAEVSPDMTIAQEEVFGPVLVIMPYTDEEDAIRIANDSSYGLAAYVQTKDIDRARKIARRLRAGGVHINYPPVDFDAPFGGFKKSGNGREWGDYGVREFMEIKSIVGYGT
jgi:aldehyde dehydrogenase (NAD+)